VSDDEVIDAGVMDRRWQQALDCLDAGQPTFSKGTLVGFRRRPISYNLDRALVDRGLIAGYAQESWIGALDGHDLDSVLEEPGAHVLPETTAPS
jgi:hypothetical protein